MILLLMNNLIIILILAIISCTFAFSQNLPSKINNFRKLKPLKFSNDDLITSLTINTAIATTAHFKGQKSLTNYGLVNAWVLGNVLLTLGGLKAWSICVLYYVIGTYVTKVKMDEKERAGIAEKRKGMRGPENGWGSAATAAICCLLMGHGFNDNLLKLAYVSSLATKASDTTASEIGKAYGKNCYLLTNFEKVPPGTEGAVSIEGTIAGIIGSILIGFYGVEIGWVEDWNQFLAVILSSFVATTIESLLGATIQNDKMFTNEFLNFINTLVGSIVSVLLTKMGGKP